MEDEFDKLMEFFSLEQKEKEKKLEEIFAYTTKFFERYKHVLSQGSDREKEEIQKKMQALREKMHVESAAAEKRTKLSSEEIRQIAKDEENFTPEQWKVLQTARQALQSNTAKKQPEEGEKPKPKKKGTQRKLGSRSKWMKS